MSLKIGDKVKFLNESGEGKVVDLADGSQIRVLADDGFEYLYSMNELIKVNTDDHTLEFQINKEDIYEKIRADYNHQNRQKSDVFKQKGKLLDLKKVNSNGIVEIDLHLEELVINPEKIKEWQRIDIQIDHFKRCMHEAIDKKIGDLIFIHGKGMGRLKQELRNELYAFPGVEYFDADFKRYGYGATHVKIKGLYR